MTIPMRIVGFKRGATGMTGIPITCTEGIFRVNSGLSALWLSKHQSPAIVLLRRRYTING